MSMLVVHVCGMWTNVASQSDPLPIPAPRETATWKEGFSSSVHPMGVRTALVSHEGTDKQKQYVCSTDNSKHYGVRAAYNSWPGEPDFRKLFKDKVNCFSTSMCEGRRSRVDHCRVLTHSRSITGLCSACQALPHKMTL